MDLQRLIEPRSIAVVGVSLSNPFHPANVIYNKNHLRAGAKTYAVNPHGGELYGESVYPSLKEVPAAVDAVVVAVRADHVPGVVRDGIEAEAGGAIVISGGFKEVGRENLQEEVRGLSQDHDFPLIGPNCLGVFSPPHMDTFFLPPERLLTPRAGEVALVSQSGGILVDLMIKLTQEGAGISRGVSIGNKAVLDEVDLVAFLEADRATRVIGLYLEGFSPGRGRTFLDLLGRIEKPVVFFKAGRSPGGSRAVQSHTASMAGDYRVFREVLIQAGAMEARDEAEFVSFCEVLCSRSAPRVKRVGVVTASGGHGAVATDLCHDAGLELPRIPDTDQAVLRDRLSPSVKDIASTNNPVDLTGSAGDGDFYASTRFFLEREDVDAVILLCLPYIPGITSDVGARVAQLGREFGKPVVTYIPHIDKYGIFIDGFESNGVPVAHSVEGAVHMARALSWRAET